MLTSRTVYLPISKKPLHLLLHRFSSYRCRLLLTIILPLLQLCHSADRLRPGESITSNQTLSSSTGAFTLGFFSPSTSSRNTSRYYYLGIWRSGSPGSSAVWVANRESPLPLSSAVFRLSNTTNNLEVADSNGTVVWSSSAPPSNYSSSISEVNMVAVVTDWGELELRRDATSGPLWRSFDQLENTLLPRMSMWVNYKTHVATTLTSWKSPEDPSVGEYRVSMDPYVVFQGIMLRVTEGGKQERRWRTNVWRGHPSTVIKNLNNHSSFPFVSFSFKSDVYWNASLSATAERSGTLAGRVEHNGSLDLYIWVSRKWVKIYSLTDGRCNLYAPCGPFSYCQKPKLKPKCSCLQGFRPRNQKKWDAHDFKEGCIRRDALVCDDGRTVEKEEEGFFRHEDMKLPDFNVFLQHVGNDRECREACRGNCSCQAYAYRVLNDGSTTKPRCLVWFGELVDVVFNNDGTGETLFLRLPPRSPALNTGGEKGPNRVAVIVPLLSGFGFLVSIAYLMWWKWQKRGAPNGSGRDRSDGGKGSVLASSLYNSSMDYETILSATDNFGDENKLGQGGFGTVYKGTLPQGKEVAIKRLCIESCQGLEEFKTEVDLMVQLQHRNLTKLLNFCVYDEERLLIYEYMPNKSLDQLLFDRADIENQSLLVDWTKRLSVVKGVARGLAYLHEDSRLKVIHRDLKAGNILLDEDMNPKISDFGVARIFGGEENEANTRRIVGTSGYISPEYAMEGVFSVRSDAYSFGVLILEMVSGKRNTNFRSTGEYPSLLSYAWELWNGDKLMEMVDPVIQNSELREGQIRKCVHIGLLCVQDDPNKRPKMSDVVFWFENEEFLIESMPEKPTFTGWTFQDNNTQHYPQA